MSVSSISEQFADHDDTHALILGDIVHRRHVAGVLGQVVPMNGDLLT